MTSFPYVRRLKERQEQKALKSAIITGLFLGWLLIMVGALRYYFLVEGDFWLGVFWLGVLLLIIATAAPSLITYPQNLLKRVGGWVGNSLLTLLLGLVYVGAVMPLGFLARTLKGRDPFYIWVEKAPAKMEGWVPKVSSDERKTASVARGALARFLEPMQVLGYFVRNGQLVFIPCLVVLLVLGLISIFAQTSALAPMIYTLF